jgi:hypothetical protein
MSTLGRGGYFDPVFRYVDGFKDDGTTVCGGGDPQGVLRFFGDPCIGTKFPVEEFIEGLVATQIRNKQFISRDFILFDEMGLPLTP